MDIYSDKTIHFKLDKDEIDIIDDVWKFADLFNFTTYTLHEYRDKIIDIIQKNYTIKEFTVLELILEKLIWNLRWLIFPIVANNNIDLEDYKLMIQLDKIPDKHLSINSYELDDYGLVKDMLYESNYYRSFINKLMVVDRDNKKIYYKLQEGSMPIFSKNDLNMKTMLIMRNRSIYEKVMADPFIIRTIKFEEPLLYYQYDYPFPNINLCCPFTNSMEERENRVKLMYFTDDCEKNWFKLHKN